MSSQAKNSMSNHLKSLAKLYGGFSNYQGTVSVGGKEWPISHAVFSNTKGRLTNKVSLALLNIISRLSRVHLVGNTAVPCFSQVEDLEPWKDVHLRKDNPCGIYIINTFSGKIEGVPHYLSIPADPMMVLHIRAKWDSFDDYLDAFTSKYRVRAKKILKETDELETQEYMGSEIDDETLALIAGLLKKTLAGKTLTMSSDLASVLKNYIKSFGDNYRIRIYSSNGNPLGFIGFVLMEQSLTAMHIGFHTPEKQNMPIYQRMLYGLVYYAIENKLESVNFGRTAVEIKSCLGAVPVRNYFIALIRFPWIYAFSNMYKNIFYKPKEYTIRSPFKT